MFALGRSKDAVGLDIGASSSIALDSADNIHISCYDFSNADLLYVTNSGGPWTTSVIDDSGDVGSDSSIAIDSFDRVHVGYLDSTNADLRYAVEDVLIPEFSGLVVPVLGMMLLVLVISARRRRR